MEGVYRGGGPTPQWIECWMEQSTDASHCEGFQLTQKGRRELDIRNAEDAPNTIGRPVIDHEWAKKAVGIGGAL